MPSESEGPFSGFLEAITYRVRLVLLTVFGPATLDEEHDPIAALRREHQAHSKRR